MTALACVGRDPELWFAEDEPTQQTARAICNGCSALRACRDGARARMEPWGMWGAETAAQRVGGPLLLDGPAEVAVAEPTHDRSRYTAGCRCRRCAEANRLYVEAWRRRPVVTGPRASTPAQLDLFRETA